MAIHKLNVVYARFAIDCSETGFGLIPERKFTVSKEHDRWSLTTNTSRRTTLSEPPQVMRNHSFYNAVFMIILTRKQFLGPPSW